MRLAFPFVVFSLTLSASAQANCGTDITVTAVPAVAAAGEPIQVTIQNDSNGMIWFQSQCVINTVYSGTTCFGSPYVGPYYCGPGNLVVGPGGSAMQVFGQTGPGGEAAPPGNYSFLVTHSAGTCCVTVTIEPAASSYCSAKINSQGCTPQIGFSGTPSASDAGVSFDVTASNLVNNKPAVLNYGHGRDNLPFLGGVLCVRAPKRLAVVQTGGNLPPEDCSGWLAFDLNPFLQSGVDPLLVPGATFQTQVWQRDPAHPDGSGAGHTAGLEIIVQD